MKTMHGNEIHSDIREIECVSLPTTEAFKCNMCEFTTTHNPGLKSHMTKMLGKTVKYLIQERN